MEFPPEFEYFTTIEPETATAVPTSSSTIWNDDSVFTYDGYVPDTVDPDWWFTIYIIVGCLFVNLSLPLWIYLGRRFGFHESPETRRRREAIEWEANYIKEHGTNSKMSGNEVLLKQLDDARSVISGYSHAPGGSVAGDGSYSAGPASVVSSLSRAGTAISRAGTHLGFHHRPHNLMDRDTASVFSGTSGFTDAVLAARPRRMPHSRRHQKLQRIVVSKSCVNGDDRSTSTMNTKSRIDVRMAAEFKRAEMDLLLQRNQGSPQDKTNFKDLTPNTTTSDFDSGVVLDDTRSEVAPSILSKLDADAISVRDAVDARDGTSTLMYDVKASNYSTKGFKERSYFSTFWDRLMTTANFDKEMKKYLWLAGHYSAQGILDEILAIVEIAVIGRFMGIRQVSAYIVVETITGFTGTITVGFFECVGVLIPQAHGARNNLMVGRYMQVAIIFYLLTALPSAIFWSFYTDDAVLWYKFDAETAQMAQWYLYATLPGYATYGIDSILYELLNTVGYESYSTWFTVIASCIHTGVVVGLLYAGVTDLYILGLVETFSDVFCLALNFGIMVRRGWLDPYWEGLFKTNGLKDKRAVKNVVNTAIPLSFAWILTYGEWEIMTLFCRHMSDTGAEVAAWGLMGYLWSAFETLTDGFGDAAEVRVGFRMGAGQVRLARLGTDKALYVSFIIAVYATGLLFILAMKIPNWLTPDPTLQKMIFDIIPLIGFGQILMVWGMVAWAILGAQGRIRIATALEFFISWGISAPVAAIFVFLFKYNIEGIVGGLSIGYTIGTNVYLYMLYTSDWESLSAVVVAQSAAEGQTYNEFDWDDLPDSIQKAAGELGYNKMMWESDEQPESNDKDWDELTVAEKRAAHLLGYNKSAWDGESDETDESTEGDKKGTDDTSQASSAESEDWANLSNEAKNAARILGYTQSIWDNNGSPPAEDKDWHELTPREQAAANTLGYTEKKWNGEDDSVSDVSTYSKPTGKDSPIGDVPGNSSEGGVLNSIISDPSNVLESIENACSFDSSKDDVEKTTAPIGISDRISSLLGLSKEEEKSTQSSAC
mmetsp:Transcript_18233/g.41998  ORF Transcript_18233/g.41998 Transcript_18233/m.41998 type:complete len:1052 (+) Transcript_18233:307-3462(+)|eukprot:CAMPEP_0197186890 /NCGR_PEP_ID=MMETSP1423-20130617/14782_1 /TAXON_ID=476441 /ORGANISM="Pseudo-nitzschia heimii, Strain UNC1101" /LENGTH=1051 /DNA_ID=CAMNT_0042638317 /DNA_START=200 /DNA_END=3355 /DNA_ORIENTATION=+